MVMDMHIYKEQLNAAGESFRVWRQRSFWLVYNVGWKTTFKNVLKTSTVLLLLLVLVPWDFFKTPLMTKWRKRLINQHGVQYT